MQEAEKQNRMGPPRLAEALLGILPALYRDCVLGDLSEKYFTEVLPRLGQRKARRWYWAQALRAVHPGLWVPLGRQSFLRRRSPPMRFVRNFLQAFSQDLGYAVRTLRKTPSFTLVAILTLALGIGANTAIFSVVHSVLLSPLPYAEGDRIVFVQHQRPRLDSGPMPFSCHEVQDYRRLSTTLDQLVEYHDMSFILLRPEKPQRVRTGVVSWNFFQVLGLQPLLGRTFVPSDDNEGAEAVLVLSYEFWLDSFGGDQDVVGRRVQMNDREHLIVGVLPAVPQYPEENDLYMTTTSCPFRSNPDFITNRNARMMLAFGRLRDGVSVEEAGREMAAIARSLEQRYPKSYPSEYGYQASVAPLHQELTRRARPTLLILLAAVGCVLLIVCANVANLNLARMVYREPEMAIRSTLGAGRWRLAGQVLVESILVAGVSGLLGLLLAAGGLGLLVEFTARFTTRAVEINIDSTVLLFTLAVSMASAIVFGLLPAWTSVGNPADRLHDNGGFVSGLPRKQRLRSLLIVAQVAISLMLLIGAGLMIRSFVQLMRVDPGFNPEHVLTMMLDLNWTRYKQGSSYLNFYQPLLEKVEADPEVVSAALAGRIPLGMGGPFFNEFRIEGRPVAEGKVGPLAGMQSASPRYFETIGVPILEGRAIDETDVVGASAVVVVNQSLARHHWGDDSPVGERISWIERGSWATIVGVVGDVRNYGLDSDAVDEIYFPLLQHPSRVVRLLIRTPGDPLQAVQMVHTAIAEMDPQQPLDQILTLKQIRKDSLASPRLTALLLGFFAALALVVTLAGITGVIAFAVSQRTREIGIRMALGAARANVLSMILRKGLALVAAGLLIGVVGAAGLSQLMSELLFGVQPTDPITYLAVSLVLATVATAACYFPARRAATIDPIRALRSE